jgi:5,10-methylenetetrahydromethanopterin reductase
VRFSVRFNNDLPVALYPELARRAEQAGFDAFWVSDDLFLRSVWVILAAAARATERIQLGTCVVNPFTQHPAEIAMAAATLDELSGGRALLGISSGADDFLSWVGLRAERPLTAVSETIAALRRLFDGDRCHPEGEFLSGWTDAAYLRFSAPRRIPIYVGAMSPRMLALIGSLADGGLPLLFPPEHFETVQEHVQRGAEAAGRDLASIDLAACIWCSISTDRAVAERALREKIAYYGYSLSSTILARLGVERSEFEPIRRAMVDGDVEHATALVTPAMLRIGVVGTAEDLLPRLDHLVQLGARHLSFGPPLGPDPMEAIDVLGRDVLPRFRE